LGGTWRLAGCRDSWSKYGLGWHVPRWRTSTTRSVELALAEAEQLAGARLIDPAPRDADRTVLPLMTIVSDNRGPFRSFRFEALFIATTPSRATSAPASAHRAERVAWTRLYGSLKYERLFLEEIDDVIDLTAHAERHSIDYNRIRPQVSDR